MPEVRKIADVNNRKITSCPMIILHSYSYPLSYFWSSSSCHFWIQSIVSFSSLSSRDTACLAGIASCNCSFHQLMATVPCSWLHRHERKRRKILKAAYLEVIAAGKNLSPLLISLPSGVQPNLEMLTFVIACLRLLDCLKHRSAESVWPNSYSLWCSSW